MRTAERRPYGMNAVTLAVLSGQLEADRKLDDATLRRRDREIGRDLSDLAERPIDQVLAWLSKIHDAKNSNGNGSVLRAERRLQWFLWLIGLFAGWLTAQAVFRYDGSRPVNVIHVVGVFVVLQWALIAILLMAMLPRRWLAKFPGGAGIQDFLVWLSLGRCIHWVRGRLPAALRDPLDAWRGKASFFESSLSKISEPAVEGFSGTDEPVRQVLLPGG